MGDSRTRVCGALALTLGLSVAVAWLPAAPAAAEADEAAMTELVQILHHEGVIDQEQYESLSAKASRVDVAAEGPAWYDKLSLWGDFRGRFESFVYDRDPNGGYANSDRRRVRYRLRLNGKAEINDHVQVFFRLASGEDDIRSTNQSLGRNNPDFDPDSIYITRAYARVTPFADGTIPGGGGFWALEGGKVGNPFVWKHGPDFMLWDHDIELEGVQSLFTKELTESTQLFLNTGFYIDQENSSSSDPNLFGIQGGLDGKLADGVALGGRTSFYRFGHLNPAFIGRGATGAGGSTSAAGNIPDGLTGSLGSETLDVIAGTAYLDLDFFDDWPILIFGSLSNNLSAQSSVTTSAGTDEWAWSTGLEIGDAKGRFALLGTGYYYIEANAFPAQFIDSDLFDGITNRKGWNFYIKRQILENTVLAVEGFRSDIIDDGVAYASSIPGSRRWRVRADVVFSF